MKKHFILFLLFFACRICSIQAQERFEYTYDDTGNRIHREYKIFRMANADTLKQQFSDKIAGHEITIFPNPTQGKITIKIAGSASIKDSKIEVYEMTGRSLFSKSSLNETTDIDLTSQFSGNYFLKIFIDGKSSQWKVVKTN